MSIFLFNWIGGHAKSLARDVQGTPTYDLELVVGVIESVDGSPIDRKPVKFAVRFAYTILFVKMNLKNAIGLACG